MATELDLEALRMACLALPHVTEDTPFGPETLVFRVGGRIFAFLPLDRPPPPHIALKCDPDRAQALREAYPGITGAFHLNKKHWNDIVCDGSVPARLVDELMRHSYDLVLAALPKAQRQALGHGA